MSHVTTNAMDSPQNGTVSFMVFYHFICCWSEQVGVLKSSRHWFETPIWRHCNRMLPYHVKNIELFLIFSLFFQHLTMVRPGWHLEVSDCKTVSYNAQRRQKFPRQAIQFLESPCWFLNHHACNPGVVSYLCLSRFLRKRYICKVFSLAKACLRYG